MEAYTVPILLLSQSVYIICLTRKYRNKVKDNQFLNDSLKLENKNRGKK